MVKFRELSEGKLAAINICDTLGFPTLKLESKLYVANPQHLKLLKSLNEQALCIKSEDAAGQINFEERRASCVHICKTTSVFKFG